MSDLHVPPPFDAAVDSLDGRHRLRFTGELDLGTLTPAEDAIERARAEGAGPLELDLTGLTFIDSSGLRLILGLAAACEADGCRLSIVPGPPPVQRVFEIAGVLDRLPFGPADPTR